MPIGSLSTNRAVSGFLWACQATCHLWLMALARSKIIFSLKVSISHMRRRTMHLQELEKVHVLRISHFSETQFWNYQMGVCYSNNILVYNTTNLSPLITIYSWMHHVTIQKAKNSCITRLSLNQFALSYLNITWHTSENLHFAIAASIGRRGW